ncbi:hypothetical protein [Streptomyces sp. NBC_00467]|uniref:hypothetical protein n=1 Tax=Streptomyces sp. NBC_00467 TaxID=2975752 RepID=UPI002E189524
MQDKAEDQQATGIVINLGGRVAVLDDINAKPKIVADRPEGTERLDVYKLTDPRQLPSGQILGIQDGSVVAIDPQAPQKAVTLTSATRWFPSVQNTQVWAINEEPVTTGCEGETIPESVRARFSMTELAVSGGPSRRTLVLPCGLEPFAETSKGIIAQQTTEDDPVSGNATVARTRVVLLDKNATAVSQVLEESATILAAAGSRTVWKRDNCNGAACLKLHDTETKAVRKAPTCTAGELVGRGAFDQSGRWYASAVRGNNGYHLALLDLDQDKCKDLGSNTNLSGNHDLDADVTATWSQSNLLVLDSLSGSLTSVSALSGKQEARDQDLDVSEGAQVWGTLTGEAGDLAARSVPGRTRSAGRPTVHLPRPRDQRGDDSSP